MAYAATKQAAKNGADPASIFADPFEYASSLPEGCDKDANPDIKNLPNAEQPHTNTAVTDDPPYPKADPEMWKALGEGKLLSKILTDFYDLVFEDENLNGFFKDTTKNRAIEKQYNFLCKVFTGEKVYFGEKPRNAHHWMIISNELFNYREAIMKACLEKHGLPAHLISRWIAMENAYKKVIVKNKPWPKVVDGVEYPMDGFGEVVIEAGTICDGCTGEIAAGEKVSYHLRLGTVYCGDCKNGSYS
jgi:truncated hemoglobin YjbI